MIIYNKLIRDKVPNYIEESGKNHVTRVLEEKEYIENLNQKLQEELNEYYENEEVEELADLVELVYSIIQYKGVSIEEFEKIRLQKKYKRGGFDKRLLLISVDE